MYNLLTFRHRGLRRRWSEAIASTLSWTSRFAMGTYRLLAFKMRSWIREALRFGSGQSLPAAYVYPMRQRTSCTTCETANILTACSVGQLTLWLLEKDDSSCVTGRLDECRLDTFPRSGLLPLSSLLLLLSRASTQSSVWCFTSATTFDRSTIRPISWCQARFPTDLDT